MNFNRITYLLTAAFFLLLTACGGGDGDSARVAQSIDAGVNNIVSIELDVGVAPNDNYVHAFGKRQYNLKGIDTNNKKIDLNDSASWSISNTSFGNINDKGFFQPNGTAGDFILLVKYANLSTDVKINVTDVALQSVAVSNDASSVDVCKTTTFKSAATFEGGLVLDFPLTWSFKDTASALLASFKDASMPVMTATKDGTVNVIATGKVGDASPVESNTLAFPINNSITEIKLTSSDSDLSLRTSETATLKAVGVYTGSTETDITSNVSYTSSDTNALTVDAKGKITAKTGSFAGTKVNVTATCNTVNKVLEFTIVRSDIAKMEIVDEGTTASDESIDISKGDSKDLQIKVTFEGTNEGTEIYNVNDVEWAIDKSTLGSFADTDISIDSQTGEINVSSTIVLNRDLNLTVTARIKNTNGSTKTNSSGQELKDTIRIVVKA